MSTYAGTLEKEAAAPAAACSASGQSEAPSVFPVSAHMVPKVFLNEEYRRQQREEDGCMRFDERVARQRLDTIRSLGIRAFNTCANFDVWWDPQEQEPIARFFRAYLDEHPDMRMSSIHYMGSVYEEDPERMRAAREQMVQVARLFGPCHPGSYVMHPGVFGEGRFKCNLPNYREAVRLHGEGAVREAVAENIRAFGEEAARFGSCIAVENLYGGRVYSALDELIELVEQVDRDNVGYCLDVGHAHADGVDLGEAVRRMGAKLFELHLHDNMGTDAHLPIGFGTIEWIPFIQALREVSYQGTASFEFFRWPDDDFERGLRDAASAWRALERVAFEGYRYYDWA